MSDVIFVLCILYTAYTVWKINGTTGLIERVRFIYKYEYFSAFLDEYCRKYGNTQLVFSVHMSFFPDLLTMRTLTSFHLCWNILVTLKSGFILVASCRPRHVIKQNMLRHSCSGISGTKVSKLLLQSEQFILRIHIYSK